MQGSANLNIMIKAARKAGRSLVKDFREVENLQVSICDDGIGFEVSPQPTQVSPQGGFGLFNIYERIHSMGGSMLIDSHPGSGTTISLSIKNR